VIQYKIIKFAFLKNTFSGSLVRSSFMEAVEEMRIDLPARATVTSSAGNQEV